MPTEISPVKIKVAALDNLISPYRAPLYQRLGEAFDLAVFYGGTEGNRPEWQNVEASVTSAKVKQSWGIRIVRRLRDKQRPGVYEHRTIHITPGYLGDLIRFAPQAVISTEMGFRTLVALLYGTLWRRPVWIWWGGTGHTERHKGRARQLLRRLVSRWAKHWISYGETSTEYLTTLGVPRQRILQIQNCVDETLFRRDVTPALHLEPRPVLLHVGRLVGLKGVDLFFRAAAQLQREGKSFSILLVGGGPEKDKLQALAGELGLRNVHFVPPQAPERMPAFYRSADALVFPTLDDVWGLVVNEALWTGLPVVSSLYAGCVRELLPKECIFDPTDQGQFVEILRRVIEGRIPPPDTGRMRTVQEVANLIVDGVTQEVCGRNARACTRADSRYNSHP